jgi:hypothetical protein
MRLYNTEGAAQVDDPEYGTFKPGESGAFDGLPDGMYAKLHGRPGWENEAERAARLTAEQMEKLRDPATMLAELQKMTANQSEFTSLLANALGMAKSADAEALTPPAPAASTAPAATTPDETPTSTPAPVKPTRTSKKAAAAPPAA